MTTTVQVNETLYDVAIRVYGNMQGVENLIKDNNLSYSSIVAPGTELIIDDTANYTEFVTANQLNQTRKQIPVVAPQANQNIFDVAIQQYGSIEGVFNLVKNNDISLSSTVEVGGKLNASGDVVEKLIYDFFKPKQKPATGSIAKVTPEPILEGIDYWAIEIDFIVK